MFDHFAEQEQADEWLEELAHPPEPVTPGVWRYYAERCLIAMQRIAGDQVDDAPPGWTNEELIRVMQRAAAVS